MVKLWHISILFSVFATWRKHRKDANIRARAETVLSMRLTVDGLRTQSLDRSEDQEEDVANCSVGDETQGTSSRQMQRMTSARDWTLDESEGTSDQLPAGYCKRCVRLAAPDALHPCNQQIPVTMVWHTDHQTSEAMARTLPCSSCDLPIDETQDTGLGACPDPPNKLPVVIWLHATNGSADIMMPRLIRYATNGFLGVAIDCRYFGCRMPNNCANAYTDAIVKAWRDGGELPFLVDNIRDLQTLLDFLVQQPFVDPTRIGMAGVSLGGMHTWLCAALDTRVAAAAPLIGVQGFQWAISKNAFHGRVDSLKRAFQLIAKECGKEVVDAAVVQNVWHRLLPGLLEDFDSPKSLPCIAPRPLLVVNGRDDPRCPVAGLQEAFRNCRRAYRELKAPRNFSTYIAPAGHQVTECMDERVESFFMEHLKPGNCISVSCSKPERT